ncbi:transmembrane protein 168-like isoform X3 [Convolutriloba macropyga]|uniref:transmembrane protein 168-like isoform X3 n=1 Tax=Convolutriloba macropyga TaxID=536237 RepID=UPI003F524660
MSYIVNVGVNTICGPDANFYARKITAMRRQPMDVKVYFAVKFVRCLSDVLLLSALSVALYNQWELTNDVTIAMLAMMSCFVFPIAIAFSYYFQMQHISQVIYSLWVGALIGVNIFLSKEAEKKYLPTQHLKQTTEPLFSWEFGQQLVDGLLLVHITMYVIWTLAERLTGMTQFDTKLLNESELFVLIGFGVAGTISDLYIEVCLYLIALTVAVIAIRMKSFWSVVNLASLLAISNCCFFPSINISPNSLLIIAFIVGLVTGPILDLYFNPSSVFDRYMPLFRIKYALKLLLVVLLMCLQLMFFSICAKAVISGERIYVTIPGFVVFGCLWLCFHLVYFLTMWNLMSRVTDCMPHISKLDENTTARLSKVMASKGMRYFCIISQRLVTMAVLTTVLLGIVAWQPNTTYMSLFLIILPIECLTLSLLNELSCAVGGTCVGYALIAPNNIYRSDGNVTPLPQNHVQDLNLRTTELLVAIQNFFRDHLIDMYGCDYSVNGLEPKILENKVKALFGSNTTDGIKYDSYILYYSGHTYQNGDWAMNDGTAITLSNILEWWREKVDDKSSRLIIMVDSAYGHQWNKSVKLCKNVCIGLQTLQIPRTKKKDVDITLKTGEFTRDWIQFNSSNETKDMNGLSIPQFAYYSVSPLWSDYTFKMPSDSDIMSHSQLHFPRFTWPFIKIVSCPYWSINLILCEPVIALLRRLKMQWLPPKILDTGHGFYFVSA